MPKGASLTSLDSGTYPAPIPTVERKFDKRDWVQRENKVFSVCAKGWEVFHMQLSNPDDLESYDPVVFGDVTLVDILHCERGIDGELLHKAKRFHKKLMGNAGKGKHELYTLQSQLWELELKLNTRFDERIRLEKGWLDQPSYELAHLFVRMTSRYRVLKEELATMETEFGKAEDLRKQILELHAKLPTYRLPRWLDRFNAAQLHATLDSLKHAIETEHKRPAEEEREKREAEAWAERRRLADAEYGRKLVVLNARKSEMERELNEFNQLVVALLGHTHFCRIGLVSPSPLKLSYVTESQLGTIGEAGYQVMLTDLRKKIGNEKRKLREPMRRIWQSVQSRGLTRLAFEAYLKQEGFGHLLP